MGEEINIESLRPAFEKWIKYVRPNYRLLKCKANGFDGFYDDSIVQLAFEAWCEASQQAVEGVKE